MKYFYYILISSTLLLFISCGDEDPLTEQQIVKRTILDKNWLITEITNSQGTDFPNCEGTSLYFPERIIFRSDTTFTTFDYCDDFERRTYDWEFTEDGAIQLYSRPYALEANLIRFVDLEPGDTLVISEAYSPTSGELKATRTMLLLD